jgi:hypothetical protein
MIEVNYLRITLKCWPFFDIFGIPPSIPHNQEGLVSWGVGHPNCSNMFQPALSHCRLLVLRQGSKENAIASRALRVTGHRLSHSPLGCIIKQYLDGLNVGQVRK